MNNNIKDYHKLICEVPPFINKYLELDILVRLKSVGYFCGMDYASKNIYDFKYKISRFDHSLSTALLVWKFTNDKKQTLAALFHDVSTPCFSHVIDYMNRDYEKQESTEEKTEEILKSNQKLNELLMCDGLTIDDIIDFKKYPIVDNERPKLCADRLDGIILTSLAWTKELNMNEVSSIIKDIKVYLNEENEYELGFITKSIADKICLLNKGIDILCHSASDNYMMELLARITRDAIYKKYITYDELYILNEKELFNIFNKINDESFIKLLNEFKTINVDEIKEIDIPNLKIRYINPLVNGIRAIKNDV